MESNRKIAETILDYWFAVEFLSQDSYENSTEETKIIQDLQKLKAEKQQGNKKRISIFKKVDGKIPLYELVKEEAIFYKMSTWGNLTIFIGKVKRQSCIESLTSSLSNISFDQAEKNRDIIPVLSFQCSPDGRYLKGSLSFSTVMWSLKQLHKNKNHLLSSVLSIEDYHKDLAEMEERFFKITGELEGSQNNERENLEKGEDGILLFSHTAVTKKQLDKIYKILLKQYSCYFTNPNVIENDIGIKFQLFKNDDEKIKYDEDNYTGLNHDFFSKDLKMVKSKLKKNGADFETGMLESLLQYICAPYNIDNIHKRYDLVKPKNKDDFLIELLKILNIKNAPIGKWPSRYMPALMQQIAINFATVQNQEDIFAESKNIFSVNGPPGTGKTTLLKEVIAGNIVKKARLLAEYTHPDEAFEKHSFKKGPLNGAYNKFTKKWFSFKNKKIEDYGILITSCNNAAVENITKELPIASGILDNLSAVTKGNHPDSLAMQEQLEEVRALFTVGATEETICFTSRYDESEKENFPEIYFTPYAKNLFKTDKNHVDPWGLIAVPLGKKSNVNSFYFSVLRPLLYGLMQKNQDIEERLDTYHSVRQDFLKQLEKVEKLQAELAQNTENALQMDATFKAVTITKEKNSKKISKLEEEKKDILIEVQKLDSKQKECKQILQEYECKWSELCVKMESCQNEIADLTSQINQYNKWAQQSEKNISILSRLFKSQSYYKTIELAASYRQKALSLKQKKEISQQTKNEIDSLMNAALAQKEKAQLNYTDICTALKQEEKKKVALEQQKDSLQKEIMQVKANYEMIKKHYENSVKVLREAASTHQGEILDASFVDAVLSSDETISTKAQITNPWTTDYYNREREKLFYLALQLTKQFLLSSKCCRANLNILGQYWGLNSQSTNRITFAPDDCHKMIGSLFQTLFLLTPVISSTFASIGSLLKDIQEPGVIGTLIIDEAGQAQPQMAVGALYRSRRAIIVGDPKQVEPVVTDDLKLLKNVYTSPILANYKDKSISVQSCADIINPFGTFFENGTDYPEWVGCPLLVHRRCISPMYDISNQISYDGIMKQQTKLPSEEVSKKFIRGYSQWINVCGNENGQGDHYVRKQGQMVCNIVNVAFEQAETPNLFIITPFTKIVSGLKKELRNYAKTRPDSALGKRKEQLYNWMNANIGTVHKFQGKEANEVVFVLGCDSSSKNSYAVKGFVNSNIVNVAVTRAKFRLYVVGDIQVWKNNPFVHEAKKIMDTLAIKNIAHIQELDLPEEEKNALLRLQAAQLPRSTSFVHTMDGEQQEKIYEIDSDDFISNINEQDFIKKDLSNAQYQEFGFSSKEEFQQLQPNIQKNLQMGMKLYFLLKPVYNLVENLDASCCAILFCKSMEMELQNNFAKGLRECFPDFSISTFGNKKIPLSQAQNKDFMIGVIRYILQTNVNTLSNYMKSIGEEEYQRDWWTAFNEKLNQFAKSRNRCCHSTAFVWKDMENLISLEFRKDETVDGVFYASKVGKKLRSKS